MADDFYPFVDSGDPAPDNRHITGASDPNEAQSQQVRESSARSTVYATRIAVYDDMLSTPRVVVVQPNDPRSYLEEITNTVYRCMKELGGSISLMVIRELVENFIHANFTEPIVSILDGGNTVRFADQGPGIEDKERAFEFGVTSANRSMKRYIRGTGAGLPMVQQYLENAGGAVSIEDNLGTGTVVTVTVDAARVREIEAHSARGAAVRGTSFTSEHDSASMGVAANGAQPPSISPAATGQMAQPYGAAYGFPQQAAPGAPFGQQMPFPYPQQPWPNPYTQPTDGFAMFGGQGGYAPFQQAYGQSYPQQNHEFSTFQQHQQQPAGTRQQGAVAKVSNHGPYVDERGMLALDYLEKHGSGGPGELASEFGNSVPTWSRVLGKLGEHDFVVKHGRRYMLTELGSSWLENNR